MAREKDKAYLLTSAQIMANLATAMSAQHRDGITTDELRQMARILVQRANSLPG